MKNLTLEILPYKLAVCRLDAGASIPVEVLDGELWSLTRTTEELSLVVPEDIVKEEWTATKGWRAFKVAGILDFSLVGIMASISAPLAEAGISMFAVSTYNTDYILVDEANLEQSITVLADAGANIQR